VAYFVDKYLVSVLFSFYENYQLSTIAFDIDNFSISGPFIDTMIFQYDKVTRVVRAKIVPFLKIYVNGRFFTIISYFPGLIVNNFMKHNVGCEIYNKKTHSPNHSSVQYWINNK